MNEKGRLFEAQNSLNIDVRALYKDGRTSPLKFHLVPLRFSMPFKSPTLFSSEREKEEKGWLA